MSDNNTPVTPPEPSAAPPPRNGCLTAIMVIIGVILLLPGLCALGFGFAEMTNSRSDPTVMLLVMLGLLVGFGGIMLIRAAIRGPRP